MEDIIKTIVVGALTTCAMVAVLYVFYCIVEWWDRKGSRTENGMQIIKKGKIPTKKVECPHCHSIIEYTRHNVWYGGSRWECKILRLLHYIDCPVCHENIVVREEEKDKGRND